MKVFNPRMSSNSVVVSVPRPPEMKMTSLVGAAVVVVATGVVMVVVTVVMVVVVTVVMVVS